MNRVTVSLLLVAWLLAMQPAVAQERGLGVVKIRSGEQEVDLYRSSHALLIAVRFWYTPGGSNYYVGFRVVSVSPGFR